MRSQRVSGSLGGPLLPIIDGCPFQTVCNHCVGSCDHRVEIFMMRVNVVVALVAVGCCCGMHVKCWRQLLFCLHVECSDVCVLVSHFSFWLMFAGVVMSVESEVVDFENEPTAFLQDSDDVLMSLPLADII